jgi:hypothetical protein
MRRLIATAFAATAVGTVLSGCGSQTDDPSGGSGGTPTAVVQETPATLTVATSLSSTRDGGMYIEGALAHIVLRDADGNVFDAGTKWPGEKFVFDGLEPGTYVLEPALRPCDGNCGYLDPPTDSCRDMLTIDGDMSVRVEFTVGDPCVVASAMLD